jgi:hypothetical protein
MRNSATLLLVTALVALGAVAVADALRGAPETRHVQASTISVPLIPRSEPASSAMAGVLFYSDPKDKCRLAGLTLPDLGDAPPPKLRSCPFSLSPSGENGLPGDAAWSPNGGLYAREDGKLVELGSPFSHRPPLHFPGRAPAFKPDGTFTYVYANEVVEWTTDCRPGVQLFTLVGDNATTRCRRVRLTEADLRHMQISADRTGPLILKDLAWLSDTRLVTVVADPGPRGYQEHLSVIEDGRVIGATISEFGKGLRVETSPRGGFFAAWIGDSLVTIRDREGDLISFPPLPRIRALTWSPDERWTVAATQHSVFVFRTNEGEARVRRLPILARDLDWR